MCTLIYLENQLYLKGDGRIAKYVEKLEKNRERRRRRIANETDQQKLRRKESQRDRKRRSLSHESETHRQERLANMRARYQNGRKRHQNEKAVCLEKRRSRNEVTKQTLSSCKKVPLQNLNEDNIAEHNCSEMTEVCQYCSSTNIVNKSEECGNSFEIEIKDERISDGEEEEHHEIESDECEPVLKVDVKEENCFEDFQEEVDLGSFWLTETVKQDPDEEEISRDGQYPPSADGGRGRDFECDICQKRFGLQFLLVAHKRIHSRETPPLLLECDVCGKSFVKRRHLSLHHRWMHARVAPHACDSCDKTFVQSSALKEHQLVHVQQKPFACASCPCWFTRLYALHVHMRTHATGDAPQRKEQSTEQQQKKKQAVVIQCEYCSEGFSEADALKSHVRRIHTGEKPYECEACERRFTRMSGLTKHKAVHAKDKDTE